MTPWAQTIQASWLDVLSKQSIDTCDLPSTSTLLSSICYHAMATGMPPHLRQVCALQVGLPQVGQAEVGPREVGVLEVSPEQRHVGEVRAAEVGAL